MINYAHRGACEYAPENTASSFYLGLLQGANGIETDVQRTQDGVLVLFHDDTLDRVTDGKGNVTEYTYKQLSQFKVYGNTTTGFYDRIMTFRAFLEQFASYDIHFAIELKGEGVEEDALSLIKEFGIFDRTTFTSFHFEYIRKIKELDAKARVGWLTENPGEEEIEKLRNICGEEMAPKADYITEDLIKILREKELGIRAWGVSNVQIMKKMCGLEIDGMTVNFPDRLSQYLNQIK